MDRSTSKTNIKDRSLRLALCTTLWSYGAHARSRAEQVVLKYTSELEVEGVDLVRVAAYSPDDPLCEQIIYTPRWHFVRVPNNPISDKWNAVSSYLRDMDIDAMMIFGSDDFLNADLIKSIAKRIKAGADFVSLNSCYFYEILSKEAIYCKNVKSIGGGRTLSAKLLNTVGWTPWKEGFNKTIDGSMNRRLNTVDRVTRANIADIKSVNGFLLGMKTGEGLNMQPYSRLKHGLESEVVDAGELLRNYIPGYAEEVLSW